MKKETLSKLQLKKVKVANLSNTKAGVGPITTLTTDPTRKTRCFICPVTIFEA
ncbi:hypothetical protein KTO58_15750 [Chitinophaga pendula]|uniref:hypothetical protein n=1 Tax=Chitinophaga TaxID=79328 RepID=UPI0012FD2011|nr:MULTISPECIES: hypothetical protein [Chitinophaga]UCJ05148.1 hypothetical protein KTO58_15750 [Chitinophaga pendula]